MSNPTYFGRRSIRIPRYDYTQPGSYFVTICTRNRKAIFGRISNASMTLSTEGKIAHAEWLRTETLRPEVCLDQFVIMPNHFHAILQLRQPEVWARRRRAHTVERFGAPVKGSLGTIIRSYKSAVTLQINRLWNTKGLSIWHRNYYEHVIRNEDDLNRIRRYILENPLHWEEDRYHI